LIRKLVISAVVVVVAVVVSVLVRPWEADRDGPAALPAPVRAAPASGSAGPGSTSTSSSPAMPAPSPDDEESPSVRSRPSSPGGDLEHRYFGDGSTVAILGDSLTVQARSTLRELLADQALKIAALNGEGMSGGPLSDGVGSPIMASMVREYAADPPDVIVVALGTNDAWQPDLDAASFERQWMAMTRAFADSCIVGVTATENTEAWNYDADDAVAVNRIIRRTSDVVVDWAELGTDPTYTGVDGIHLTDAGRERFALLINRGVDRCLS